MATIKSYTDISQSKKLAEILPLDSADMCFNTHNNMPPLMTPSRFNEFFNMEPTPAFLIPCWSLAALLGVLPKTINFGYENDSTFVLKPLENGKYLADYYEVSCVKDNPIDACVAMIEKLNELKLL